MRLAAGLTAMLTYNAVGRICFVCLSGACVTVCANGAIRIERYVSRAGDGLATVLANGTICRRRSVRCFSRGAAYVTVRIANEGVGVLRAGDRLSAVFANKAVIIQMLVTGAGTNVAAKLAAYVMLVSIFVRRNTLKGVTKVANGIACIRVGMLESRFAFLGFRACDAAFAANLVKDLCIVAIRFGLGYPVTEFMADFGRLAASCADGAIVCMGRMSKSADAFLGFFSAAFKALSCKDLCIVAICRCLFGPFNTLEIVLYGSCRAAGVTSGVAIVVVIVVKCKLVAGSGCFLMADRADLALDLILGAACGGLGFPCAEAVLKAACLTADGADLAIGFKRRVAESCGAGSGFFCAALVANPVLDLCIGAVFSRLGYPFAESMLNAACLAADTADGAIIYVRKMSGTFAVVSAFVTYEILDAVINVGRNALEAASILADRIAIIHISVSVSGSAGSGLFYAAGGADAIFDLIVVAILGGLGFPCAEAMLEAACLAADGADLAIGFKRRVAESRGADSGFFCAANRADAVLDLVIHAVFDGLGFPFAEGVCDHSDVIASLAVTGSVAGVGVGVSESGPADLGLSRSANGAESFKDLCGRAGYGNVNLEIRIVGVRDLSLCAATVALNVAIVGVDVVKRGSAFLRFLCAAIRTVSCENFSGGAACGSLGSPSTECVHALAESTASVTVGIAAVVVGVIVDGSYLAADVTVSIAGVIVNVRIGISERAAKVTVVIASVGVLASRGCGVLRAADVTGEGAGVGENVSLGDSERGANVTVLVAIVGVLVLGDSQCTAEFAVGVAVGLVNMLGSRSRSLTNVTFAVAGAIENVRCVSGFSFLAAQRARLGACTRIFMLGCLADLAASVTFNVGAAVIGVFRQRLAHFNAAVGADGSAVGFVLVAFSTEAARENEEHQHNGQCTEQ